MFMHNFCSCCIKKLKVTNLTLCMYLFYTYMPFIYVDTSNFVYYSMKGVPEARVSEDGVCCKVVFL